MPGITGEGAAQAQDTRYNRKGGSSGSGYQIKQERVQLRLRIPDITGKGAVQAEDTREASRGHMQS
jgi:hypothetical protein